MGEIGSLAKEQGAVLWNADRHNSREDLPLGLTPQTPSEDVAAVVGTDGITGKVCPAWQTKDPPFSLAVKEPTGQWQLMMWMCQC